MSQDGFEAVPLSTINERLKYLGWPSSSVSRHDFLSIVQLFNFITMNAFSWVNLHDYLVFRKVVPGLLTIIESGHHMLEFSF